MVDTVAHRSPDDQGSRIHENVGFGHRRLSILDLFPEGHQPMSLKENGLTNEELYQMFVSNTIKAEEILIWKMKKNTFGVLQ